MGSKSHRGERRRDGRNAPDPIEVNAIRSPPIEVMESMGYEMRWVGARGLGGWEWMGVEIRCAARHGDPDVLEAEVVGGGRLVEWWLFGR